MRMLMSHLHWNNIDFEVQEAKRLMSDKLLIWYELERETSTVLHIVLACPCTGFTIPEYSHKVGTNFLCVDMAAVVEIPGTPVSEKVSTYELTSSVCILCLLVARYNFFIMSAINLEKWLEVLEVRLEVVIRVLHILVATMTFPLPFVTISCN